MVNKFYYLPPLTYVTNPNDLLFEIGEGLSKKIKNKYKPTYKKNQI